MTRPIATPNGLSPAHDGRSDEARDGVGDHTALQDVFIDLTHLGRHVTGIERVSIEQFESVKFSGARVRHVRSNGVASMIWRQQILLPLLALVNPRAIFVFPGFPPSPWFTLIAHRVVMYVHDLFLITRRDDLGLKAKLYMAAPFKFAVSRLTHFQVNSEKTRAELIPFAPAAAAIALYRPVVRNVFNLDAGPRTTRGDGATPLSLVSLGTVEPRKNYGAALAILDALIANGHTGARLHIIGREGWGEAKDAIANHPAVTIHGYLPSEDVKAVLEAADAYLCTSHDEGLGLPLLEAQFAGLPVIAPDKPVFREVLGTSGAFIDPTNATTSARTISSLLAQPGWRTRTTRAASTNVARWNALAGSDAVIAQARFATTTPT
jgi:glycosyltransferase involved in cell wall biosynthesis